MRPVNRITPQTPVQAMKTYAISAPADVKIKTVCEEIRCPHWRHGWQSMIDESTELGQRQATYIRQQAGRTFHESRTGEGMTVFRFESGQRCFTDHRTRPETYRVRGGDWRQHLGVIREHTRPADWVEDFSEHQDNIARLVERG